jgi:hypothetical protein
MVEELIISVRSIQTNLNLVKIITEVEVEVEVASAEEVEDGGFATVEVGGVRGNKHIDCFATK